MEESSTERFLRRMNEFNERVAAQDAAARPQGIGVDPVRERNDAARREKYGEQLRARPKSSKRPHRARHVFPRIDLS